jgi:putative effector of murein hydrolase LrgA (UPF0299 family)
MPTSTPSKKPQGRFRTAFLPAIKPLRILWNEVIGFLFIVIGLMFLPAVWRTFRQFEAGNESIWKVLMPLALAVLLLYFGISSFWKARKISKS